MGWTIGGSGGGSGALVDCEIIGSFGTVSDQSPTGLGDANKIKINVGVGGNTTGNEFTVTALGDVQCNSGGVDYGFNLILRVGRSGGAGEAQISGRLMYAPDGVNFSQLGSSFMIEIDNAKTVWRESITLNFAPVTGSILFFELARNNSGNNSGGLTTIQPDGDMASWNSSETAHLEISRLVVR